MPSTFEVFKAFLYIGATAFGGGGSAHIQAAVVTKHHWLTPDEFLESYTLSQTLPGPIFSNLAAQIGSRLAGVGGGVVACIGVSLPGSLLILLLALLYSRLPANTKWLEGALTGIGAGAVGVLLAMMVNLAPSALKTRVALLLAATAFVANAVLHISILWILVTLVPLGIWLDQRFKRA